MPGIPYAGPLCTMPSPPYCSVHGVEIAYLFIAMVQEMKVPHVRRELPIWHIVEDKLAGWKITVGPREANAIPQFLKTR